MEKHKFVGKTKEEAIEEAKIKLQETEENLIINELEIKTGLFKSKKVEIEVIEKREVISFIKDYLYNILKDMGFSAKIEVKKNSEVPKYIIYTDKDSLVIGKNGKNLDALSKITIEAIKKEISRPFKFLVDVNDYKEKHEKSIEYLSKKIAREVGRTKVEAKLDSMNSYERRIVHNVLNDNKYVYTESVGEEPNRCVIIKPKED